MPDHRADWLRAAQDNADLAHAILEVSRRQRPFQRAREAVRAMATLVEAEACLEYAEGCER